MSYLVNGLILTFSYGLNFIGLPLFSFFGRVFGLFLEAIRFRHKTISINLELAFGRELTSAAVMRLKRDIYRNLGTVFLEILRNFSLDKKQIQEELHIGHETRAKIETILARKKGLIIISAHTSNWELCAMGVAAHGFKTYIVVRKIHGKISQFLISKLRRNSGLNIIYSGGVLAKMKQVLAEGSVVGIMLDQHKTGSKAVRASFFGIPADSIRGIANLVKETGTPVLPGYAARLADGRHELRVLDEVVYEEAVDSQEEELINTQKYQDAIEQIVRAEPDKWMWAHRRWKAVEAYKKHVDIQKIIKEETIQPSN